MNDPKVTILNIIENWKSMTSQSSVTRWDEMQALFAELQEAGLTAADVMRRKDAIIRIWCPITWQEAQKLHPEWRDKSWYDNRKKGTLKTFDKWYSDMMKAEKAAAPASAKPQQRATPILRVVGQSFVSQEEQDYYSQFEIFTTHKQVLDHTKQHLEKQKKEWAHAKDK